MMPSAFWLTGLSGAGKTTVATHVYQKLQREGQAVVLLDGDLLRNGLCSDLGFSISDRKENIRRVAEVSRLFLDHNTSCICTFISPTADIRQMARSIIGFDSYYEVYVSTPLAICQQRDPKGLYQKVRNGEIRNFTGIDSVYEPPKNADLVLNCSDLTVAESTYQLLDFIHTKIRK